MEKQINFHNYKRAILVSKAAMVAGPVRNAITLIEEHGTKIDVFLEEELLINIAEHNLVPKHEILSKEETEQLLNRYKVTKDKVYRLFEYIF